ncbi:Type I restriction enzyme specificity protein MG438 [Citrobacter youngae]|uniref:restriction endonuclease subunit S n=1 Tax=Enterobacteriaceae TaxID=543 RepID=UPI000F517F23|nr:MULTISPECIES: restriction endonuclease subunit S [Enterobacteriaceae]QCC90965.1 restriction endonuclease subunit S [Enterobacter cloacae]QCC95964.1 restriction endonuclease subunit S [Enterobacter cloacae]RPH27412.1 restriction endonuclease subunit S [Citrobacter youngae]ULK47425.1 restriction endonuclease subunit S [Klebsiella pneumoniae]UMU29568.1 restriction endonuclease subunit S [Klebsiella pneumoniae]
MSEWKKVLLTDVSVKIGDGLHGTPIYDESGDYYFINGNNLLHGRVFIKPETKKITKAEFDKIKKDLNSSTLLISINGTIGNVSKYAYEKCALGKSVCYINLDENIILRDYFYYECLSDNFKSYLDNIATGTTIPNVPLKGLRSYEFRIPPITEQKAIASVLSSLDDKIDLLQRQNKTLESMAETLFRQWFIEEDADDWEVIPLGKVVNIAYGKNLPTSKLTESGYPVFGGNGQIGFYHKYLYEKPQVLVSCRGEASGKVNISLPNSFITNNSLILELIDNGITFEYLKYYSLNYDFKLHVSGSAQPQITINGLFNADFKFPPLNKILFFSSIVKSSELKIFQNSVQINKIENLRDTLLPKLMSGEVRVQYAEEVISAVV